MKNIEAENLKRNIYSITQSSFNDQILNKLGENEKPSEVKKIAKKYISKLRNEEKSQIENNNDFKNTPSLINDLNDTNEEIEEIINNKPVILDTERLKSTTKKIYKFFKENKATLAVRATTGTIGILSLILGELDIKESVIKAGEKIDQLGLKISNIHSSYKSLKFLANIAGKSISTFAHLVIKAGEYLPIVASIITIILFIAIIKRWRGK